MRRAFLLLVVLAATSCFGKDDEDTGPDWSTCSNSTARLDMPFTYTMDGTRLLVPNEAADADIYVHLGSFGAHFAPLTDHNYGDPKANLVGFFSSSDADLEETSAGVMAYFGGLDGSILHANRPVYRAPLAGKITEMSYVASTTGYFLDDEPTWKMLFKTGDIAVRIYQVGKFHDDFAASVLSATGVDLATYSDEGTNLLGSSSISVAAGDPLGYPQVVATPVAGFDGYYRGEGSFYPDRPSIPMEFSVVAPITNGFDEVCFFKLLGTTKEQEMQTAFDLDLLDSNSQRFGPWESTEWQWRAEGDLCLFCNEDTAGYYGLYERLGAWWESDDYGSDENETLSFAWINTLSSAYSSGLYAGNQMGYDVDCLVSRRRNDGDPYLWTVPGEGLLTTEEPVGEIIESSANNLLILWRNLGNGTQVGFQKLYFVPGTGANSGHLFGMWGEFASTPGGAETPDPFNGPGNWYDANGNTRIWYDLTWRPGF
jgi:hypothetical protein